MSLDRIGLMCAERNSWFFWVVVQFEIVLLQTHRRVASGATSYLPHFFGKGAGVERL